MNKRCLIPFLGWHYWLTDLQQAVSSGRVKDPGDVTGLLIGFAVLQAASIAIVIILFALAVTQ